MIIISCLNNPILHSLPAIKLTPLAFVSAPPQNAPVSVASLEQAPQPFAGSIELTVPGFS